MCATFYYSFNSEAVSNQIGAANGSASIHDSASITGSASKQTRVLTGAYGTGKRLCHAHVMPGGFPPSKRSITKVTPKSCLSLFPHLNACATDSKYTRNNGLNQALLW